MNQENSKLLRRIMRAASNMNQIEPGIFQHKYLNFVFDCDDAGETIDSGLEYLELAYNAEGRAQGIEEAKQLLSTLK
jgi:hypothetical protein